MKKISRTFHLLLTLSLVLLPMRAVLADFSVMPMEVEMGAKMQVADHHAGVQSHHNGVDSIAAGMPHEILMAEHVQMDKSSTDCHDHTMSDCEACTLHFTLKNDIGISWLPINPTSYTDYSVPVVTLFLPGDIRPPIL